LSVRQYDSADQQDLFKTLNVQAEIDSTGSPHASVPEIMQSWTLKPGFPLITVTHESPNELKLTQVQKSISYDLNSAHTMKYNLIEIHNI